MAQPKFFFNEYYLGRGYPWAPGDATTSGTGATSVRDLGRNLSNGIKCELVDTTSSQAFFNLAKPCPAGVWCAILVEILDFDLTNYSGGVGGNSPIKCGTTTNVNVDASLDDRAVSFDQIKAGGAGWYCIWMKYDVTTTPTIRAGLGVDSGMTNGPGFIEFGRVGFFVLKQDNLEPGLSGNVPSYALPDHPNSYSVTGNRVDANDKVIWGTTSIGEIDRYSVIYSIGDSKSDAKGTDSPTTLPTQFNTSVYNYGVSSQGTDYMIANIAHLQEMRVENDVETARDIWADINEFPQAALRPNCLMFCNFGVNNIDGDKKTASETLDAFMQIKDFLGYKDVIITELNPWGSGIYAGTAGELAEMKTLHQICKDKCRAEDWVYVHLHHDLSDFPANPENLLPAISADGLHMFKQGSLTQDGLIIGAIQEFNQRRNS